MLRRTLASLVLVASTLSACGGEDITPVDGVWRYLGSTLASNSCGDGTFESSTEMSGTQTVELTCEGASCPLANTLLQVNIPCSYSYDFTAKAD